MSLATMLATFDTLKSPERTTILRSPRNSDDALIARLLHRLSAVVSADTALAVLRSGEAVTELARLGGAPAVSPLLAYLSGNAPAAAPGADPLLTRLAGLPCLMLTSDFDAYQLVIAVARQDGRELALTDVRKLRPLLPWISEYTELWWSARSAAAVAERIAQALQTLPLELALVAGDCRVLTINPAATAKLASDCGLRVVKGRLAAADLGDDIRLKTVVYHAAGDLAGGATTQVLRVTRRGRRPLIVAVGACGGNPAADDGAALVQIIDPETNLAQHVEVACALYNLGGSEARLAQLLVAGHSLLDAATRLRVQPDTARTYLKQIFIKTGVNRQAALVQLLLSSAVRSHPGSTLRIV